MAVSSKNALAFVEWHGIVLESGHGPVPNLAEAIAGGAIRGSWWGHKKGRAIFAATRLVRDADEILVCRLLQGKVTYVHRRLWPALVRVADKLTKKSLAAVCEEHTASGAHHSAETPFPDWIPPDVKEAAQKLSEQEALEQLGEQVAELLRDQNRQARQTAQKNNRPGTQRRMR
ncbi:hypothetical protein AYO44_11165 [Planctomycetaceae bacterium SCGC AG-212-F19]|nr:hypothetical protein AYO44_11165 [Planctomycetaceae bacterium SCGC AG-212-F19]